MRRRAADSGDLGAAVAGASSVLGEREEESGEQPGARGGPGSFKSRPRSGRRAHDARGAGAVRRRLRLTGRGRGRKGAALTAGPGGQRLGAERRRGGCLARCWAGAATGLAVGGGLGRGAGKGESWAAVLGRAGKRGEGASGPISRKGKKKRKKILSFSISSTIFQIPF